MVDIKNKTYKTFKDEEEKMKKKKEDENKYEKKR